MAMSVRAAFVVMVVIMMASVTMIMITAMAMRLILGSIENICQHGGNAVAECALAVQFKTGQGDFLQRGTDRLLVRACVDKGCKQHVASNPELAVQVQMHIQPSRALWPACRHQILSCCAVRLANGASSFRYKSR